MTADPGRSARRSGPRGRPTADEPPDTDAPSWGADDGAGPAIASSRDPASAPVHRGWAPVGARHRWLEPFVLMALANGAAHGYAIVGELTDIGITEGALDVGQVYRTLRDLEQAGQVISIWATGIGPARREYTITELGSRALDEWAAVMKERQRLIAEFDATYLAWVAEHPKVETPG